MTLFTLIPHPDFPPLAARSVTVEVERAGGDLRLRYRIEGASEVVWPAPAMPERTDELWKATCFELFAKPDGGEGYVEFNFSPSGRWAAYAFDGYREGMRDLPLPVSPRIERLADGVAVVTAVNGGARIALTAVIEETGGRRSFWSLAHPPGAPDFHHKDCFVARLPAPERP